MFGFKFSNNFLRKRTKKAGFWAGYYDFRKIKLRNHKDRPESFWAGHQELLIFAIAANFLYIIILVC